MNRHFTSSAPSITKAQSEKERTKLENFARIIAFRSTGHTGVYLQYWLHNGLINTDIIQCAIFYLFFARMRICKNTKSLSTCNTQEAVPPPSLPSTPRPTPRPNIVINTKCIIRSNVQRNTTKITLPNAIAAPHNCRQKNQLIKSKQYNTVIFHQSLKRKFSCLPLTNNNKYIKTKLNTIQFHSPNQNTNLVKSREY